MRVGVRAGIGGFLMGAAACLGVDLGTYNGCTANDSEFTTTQIFQGPYIPGPGDVPGLNSVLKVAFHQPSPGVTDVYFIRKWGEISRYNGSSKSIDSLGALKVHVYGEHGLLGIAIDPDFKTNRYLYVNYSFVEPDGKYSIRISRLTLGGDDKIDVAGSEKVLIKIPRLNNWWTTSGAMMFDAYGDLYCAIADNMQTEATAGNTADLRGGILRIHPDAGDPRGYTIPKDNFGEVFSEYFRSRGNTAVAEQYLDTNMVKAQIFMKGSRCPYTLGMDRYKRWIAWGDVGPDHGRKSEEYNMVKGASFGGWPYFAGEENMGGTDVYGVLVPRQSDPNAPMNNFAGISGVKELPPVTNAIFARQQSCAMGGPIFTYDGTNPSPTQFPPQFNHKWLISDCNGPTYGYRLLSFDSEGNAVQGGDALKIFAGGNVHKSGTVVDMQQGPDGALYIVDWAQAGIYRVDYTGACKDQELTPTRVFRTASGRALSGNPIAIQGADLQVSLEGGYEIKVVDMAGRAVFAARGSGKRAFHMPAMDRAGVYQIAVKGDEGIFTRQLMRLAF